MPSPGLWPLSWPEPLASLCSLVIKDDLCQILLVPCLGQDTTDLEIKALSWIRSEFNSQFYSVLCALNKLIIFYAMLIEKFLELLFFFFFVGLNKIKHMKVCGEEPRTYRASASCMTLPWILAAPPQHCQIAVVIIHTTNKDGECWEWNGGD